MLNSIHKEESKIKGDIMQITTIKDLAQLTASDIMTTPVTTVHIWDSIHDVAKIFVENNISSVAVVDMEDVPLGVITKSDLARYHRERSTLVVAERDKKPLLSRKTSEDVNRKGFHLEPEESTVENWMTPALFDVHPTTILAAIVKKMVKNGLHHLFVTDGEKKKITGIITTFDIVMMMEKVLNPGE
jgi:CBS domain-containing protein